MTSPIAPSDTMYDTGLISRMSNPARKVCLGVGIIALIGIVALAALSFTVLTATTASVPIFIGLVFIVAVAVVAGIYFHGVHEANKINPETKYFAEEVLQAETDIFKLRFPQEDLR